MRCFVFWGGFNFYDYHAKREDGRKLLNCLLAPLMQNDVLLTQCANKT
jgi:hypothetical protein